MFYKTIIQGRLEFGTEKTYEKAHRMYMYRMENYHKSSVIWKEGEIFDEENFRILIPRYVGQSSEKVFKNTLSLIAYCAQFALAGSVVAWLIDEGKILQYNHINPESDKAAVQQYIKGKNLVKLEGKEDEAIEALNKAIEKYDKHAQAYERRAKVNYILKKYHDAARDYDKSLSIDDTNPHAYFGRAKVSKIREEYDDAVKYFDLALKNSLALQPLYWKARRFKAEIHILRKEWTKAAFDLKLFSNRNFSKEDVNYHWKKWALFEYGKVLIEQKEYLDALSAFEKALLIEEEGEGRVSKASILRCRSIAKKNAGKNGYIKDMKEAADLGDKEAITLLKDMGK